MDKRKGIIRTMDDRDFSELGREIGEKIDQFVNSKEIKELQENIRKTVESTVDEVRKSAQDAVGQMNRNVSNMGTGTRSAMSGAAGNGARPGMGVNHRNQGNGHAYTYNGNRAGTQMQQYGGRQLPVVKKPQGQVSGVLMEVLGICGATIGWTTAFLGYSLSMISIDLFGIGIGAVSATLSAVIAAICTACAVIGGNRRRRAGRFKKYIRTMENKDFYSISGLANTVQKNIKYVVKDLKWMIHKGWFREGHLDQQETCFMLTNESYQMYLDAQSQLARRKEEEERRAREQEMIELDPLKKQLYLTIEEGKEYIRRIRKINDDIPGEEISNKLYRLEEICKRIFMYIEKKPEKLSDIRKFMNYYLPTSLKLVEQYRDFDMQPLEGENITASKKEIEEMLDEINKAFEKMYDKLFADDAMDVSTDISVLSTMLAQEGLLEDEFKMK